MKTALITDESLGDTSIMTYDSLHYCVVPVTSTELALVLGFDERPCVPSHQVLALLAKHLREPGSQVTDGDNEDQARGGSLRS